MPQIWHLCQICALEKNQICRKFCIQALFRVVRPTTMSNRISRTFQILFLETVFDSVILPTDFLVNYSIVWICAILRLLLAPCENASSAYRQARALRHTTNMSHTQDAEICWDNNIVYLTVQRRRWPRFSAPVFLACPLRHLLNIDHLTQATSSCIKLHHSQFQCHDIIFAGSDNINVDRISNVDSKLIVVDKLISNGDVIHLS